MTNNMAEIMNKGMRCLRQQLGTVEAEQFDYTKWHQSAFDGASIEEINNAAADYEMQNPYQGQAKYIL